MKCYEILLAGHNWMVQDIRALKDILFNPDLYRDLQHGAEQPPKRNQT
jgi:hypothetical protein